MKDQLRVVCYLLKKRQVLLGQRKEGIGEGKFVGIGGKVEEGEKPEETIVREVKEEINVTIIDFEYRGQVDFEFVNKPDWSQNVALFTCTKWEGEPQESDEIRPEWFSIDKLPFGHMWDDAPFWLPKVLKGGKIFEKYTYNEQNKVII